MIIRHQYSKTMSMFGPGTGLCSLRAARHCKGCRRTPSLWNKEQELIMQGFRGKGKGKRREGGKEGKGKKKGKGNDTENFFQV